MLIVEPFKINCVTCQASLSVRSESLLGQIVACPRCGSMVEVALPSAEGELPVAEPVDEPVAALAEAAVESEPFSSVSVTPVASRKILVWPLAGLLIGAVGVGWGVFRPVASEGEVASSKSVVTEEVVQPTVSRISAEVPEVLSVDDLPVVEEISEITSEPEIVADALPVAPSVETLVVEPEVAEAPVETPQVARRFDPLDFDPERMTLGEIDRGADGRSVATSDAAVVEPTEDAPLALEAAASTTPVARRGPAGDGSLGGRDAEKQLGFVFPSLEVENMPLVDCLRLFSQMSGVGVSVAPEELLMAGLSPQTKVSLVASELRVGEMLGRLLKPLRLEYEARGSQVIVRRQGASKSRTIDYPIDDLLLGSTEVEQLIGWIEALVAPKSWQSSGGEGTCETTSESLHIEQTERVHYQVLIFLERLRLSRGLPPRSRFPTKRLFDKETEARLDEQLARSTTFTFSQFTPLDDVFVYWQTELGVPLLIDWPALATVELGPRSTMACAIADRPWSEALERVLEPLGLGWRTTPGGAVEITTAEKVQTELRLDVFALRRDLDVEVHELVTQLRKVAEKQSGGHSGTVAYDPVGHLLFSLEPASVQRLFLERLESRLR